MGSGVAISRVAAGRLGQAQLENQTRFASAQPRRVLGCADAAATTMEDDMFQDLRYALRILRKNPGFTLVAVFSLALGIGGNGAMFSLVNNALVRPLPYPRPDSLMRVTESYPKGSIVALQEQGTTLEVAGYTIDSEFNLTGQGEAARLVGSQVTSNLFTLLGAPARIGRTFEAGEDLPTRDNLVVLSHALWRNRFASDPNIIGRPIAIDGVARQVIGVMAPDFGFPSSRVQLWIPARMDPDNEQEFWNYGWMQLIGRIRPGASLPQAREELRLMISRIIPLFPWATPLDWNASATLIPLQESLTGDIRAKLLLLLCAVGCVLLIACANVASLSLARTAARRREMSVRAALGAGRGRIVRQLLTESVLLAAVGGGLGLALATGSLSVLKSILPVDNSLVAGAGVDWQVFAFVAALAVLTGLGFGLAPALSAARMDLVASLKTRGGATGGVSGTRLRNFLIVGEVTLAVALVISAGLLIKSLWLLNREDPGFRPDRILTVRVYPRQSSDRGRATYIALYNDLVNRARSIAGVTEVAAANTTPLSGDVPAVPVELEGHPLTPADQTAPMLWAGAVTPGYFEILRIPILGGRSFNDADGEQSSSVVLVSAATANQFWPGENPIGKHIRVVWEQRWRTVVGVAGDVRQYDLAGATPGWISGAFYMPYSQSVSLDRKLPTAMTLILRAEANAQQAGIDARRLVSSANPDVPVGEIRAMESIVSGSTSSSRYLMWLFISFGGCALALAAIGAYGVVSYSAAQRSYEMGVRMALGATRGRVFALVMRQSLRLVLTGLALGLTTSLALKRLITSVLYGVTATDPMTLIVVAFLLMGVGFLAGYFPARRAAAIDPMVALRHE